MVNASDNKIEHSGVLGTGWTGGLRRWSPAASDKARRRAIRSRSALTLLELLLALALTSLLMVAISTAISLHLRALDARRADVEEARIARAVLRLIANDVRGAVSPKPIDLSGFPDISELLLGEVLDGEGDQEGDADGGGGDVDGGAAGPDAAGGAEDADRGQAAGGAEGATEDELLDELADTEATTDEEDATMATTDISSSAVAATVPGVYGNQFELQVDMSRLPRADEYQTMMSEDVVVTDLPSDIKTVAYYVAAGELDIASGGDATSTGSGLVRRELDRAVTLWAASNGDTVGLSTGGVVIAPEVASIEFQYFDGLEWYTEWDSEANSGVPVAIDITIGITPLRSFQAGSTVSLDPTLLDGELRYYNLVVYLPISEPATEETTEAAF